MVWLLVAGSLVMVTLVVAVWATCAAAARADALAAGQLPRTWCRSQPAAAPCDHCATETAVLFCRVHDCRMCVGCQRRHDVGPICTYDVLAEARA